MARQKTTSRRARRSGHCIEAMEHRLLLAVTDPNDTIAEAMAITLPYSGTGTIASGDVNMYKFSAVGAVKIDIDRLSGSLLDSYVRIFDSAGNEVYSNNNANGPGEGTGKTLASYLEFVVPGTKPVACYLGISAVPNTDYDAVKGTGDVATTTNVGDYQLTINAPEIGVEGGDSYVDIVDGATAATIGDGTSFGTSYQFNAPTTRTYTVGNSGTAAMSTSVTVPAGFTITEPLSSSIAAGSSDTFTVALPTSKADAYSGAVSITCNDADENPFTFTIAGQVIGVPDIRVTNTFYGITNGDSTPSLTDSTDFGSALQGGTGVTRTFAVYNDGGGVLYPTVTLPTGFAIGANPLATSIGPYSSDTFTITQTTTLAATYTGPVAIDSNDPDEDPYTFSITGRVSASAAADLVVTRDQAIIADGDSTPSTDDATDYGTALLNAFVPFRTYVLRNTGTAPLTFSTPTAPTGFMVLVSPTSPIQPGGIGNLTIALTTATAGDFAGDVVIPGTNDPDAETYNFRIAGKVLATDPVVTLAVAEPSSIAENAGATTLTAQVTVDRPVPADMPVSLLSDRPDIVVPATVTIPAGESSVSFPITAVDNAVLDGTRTATISATCAWGTSQDTVQVTDNEVDPPPSATIGKLVVKNNARYTLFAVTYRDNLSVNAATTGKGDILVTGPRSFRSVAAFVSRKAVAGGVVATYKLIPPKGTWNSPDNGTYYFNLQANQVADGAGHFALPKRLATLKVKLPAAAPAAAPVLVAKAPVPLVSNFSSRPELLTDEPDRPVFA